MLDIRNKQTDDLLSAAEALAQVAAESSRAISSTREMNRLREQIKALRTGTGGQAVGEAGMARLEEKIDEADERLLENLRRTGIGSGGKGGRGARKVSFDQ